MTLEEYCDHLERRAIGWLDWSEERALYADVNAIEVGIAGKLELFETLGLIRRSDKPTKAPSGPPLDARGRPITISPKLFDEMFDREPGTWQVRVKGAHRRA